MTDRAALSSLALTPLAGVNHGTALASHASRSELGMPPISPTLGFTEQIDLYQHPDGKTRVAADMLHRLRADAASR